jgi:hypothetical protein
MSQITPAQVLGALQSFLSQIIGIGKVLSGALLVIYCALILANFLGLPLHWAARTGNLQETGILIAAIAYALR